MKKKIKRPNLPTTNPFISEAKRNAEKRASELINFSLKYLDCNHKKFNYTLHDSEYFCEILERIKQLSLLTKIELLTNRSGSLKTHPIDWKDTSIKIGFGFPHQTEIVDVPYQFSITKNEFGRVHGFFIYNTFYIVWLDKDHLLYD